MRNPAGGSRIASRGRGDPNGEGGSGRGGGVPRVGQGVRIDAEFRIGVGGEGIVSGELLSEASRRLDAGPLDNVDGGKLLQLVRRGLRQLGALFGQQGSLGVTLAADRDVLSESHRHGASNQTGYARRHDGSSSCGRTSHSDHEPSR